MSEIDSAPYPVDNAAKLLVERENDLNCLLDQMDQLQNEVDNLNQKLGAINLEIAKNKQEQSRIKLINRNLDLEPLKAKHQNQVDENSFTGEHLDLIKSKRNDIALLLEQINQLQAVTQPIDDLVSELQQENVILLCEKSSTAKQTQKALADKKRITLENQDVVDHIKELNISITNQERVARDVETIVSGLITRRDAIYSQSDPNSELQQKIRALQVQKDLIQTRNDEMLDEIENFQENINEISEDVESQINTMKTKINWERERQKLQIELADVQKRLNEAKEETVKVLSQVSKAENRMTKIKPIIQKWSSEFRGIETVEDDSNIDKLLQRCKKQENTKIDTNTKSDIDIDNLIFENNKLTETIARKKEELSRSITKFSLEKSQLKNEIKTNRTKAFETEHNIVEQIKKLKIKAAKKPAKK